MQLTLGNDQLKYGYIVSLILVYYTINCHKDYDTHTVKMKQYFYRCLCVKLVQPGMKALLIFTSTTLLLVKPCLQSFNACLFLYMNYLTNDNID